MPYVICYLNKAHLQCYKSYNQKKVAEDPGIIFKGEDTSLDIIVVTVKEDLAQINYSTVNNLGRLEARVGEDSRTELMFCFKLDLFDPNTPVGTRVNVRLASPQQLVGCIPYSSPRITDPTAVNYCVTHKFALKSDRDELVASIKKSFTGYPSKLIICEDLDFSLPKCLTTPPSQKETQVPAAPQPEASAFSRLFNWSSSPNSTNNNDELSKLFTRAKNDSALAEFLLAKAKEFDIQSDKMPAAELKGSLKNNNY